MFRTKLQHLLGLGDTSNHRTRETSTSEQKAEGIQFEMFCGRTDKGNIAVTMQEVALGISPVSNASELFVRAVECKNAIRAELLETGLALRAGTIRVDEAADSNDIAQLVLDDGGTDASHAAYDFVPRNNRINRRPAVVPFVPHMVQIRMANAAEENLDLYIVVSWIAPCNRSRRKERCCTSRRISFRVEHKHTIVLSVVERRAKRAIIQALHAKLEWVLILSDCPLWKEACPLQLS